MEEIILADGENASPMAIMIADLLKENIKQRPYKKWDLRMLKIPVLIDAKDVGIKLTLEFDRGRLTVHDGEVGNPKIILTADSEAILELSQINITLGLPNYIDETGRGIVKKLLKGEIKLKGMLRHHISLTMLTRLMSVNG